jgi:hypothetical protein
MVILRCGFKRPPHCIHPVRLVKRVWPIGEPHNRRLTIMLFPQHIHTFSSLAVALQESFSGLRCTGINQSRSRRRVRAGLDYEMLVSVHLRLSRFHCSQLVFSGRSDYKVSELYFFTHYLLFYLFRHHPKVLEVIYDPDWNGVDSLRGFASVINQHITTRCLTGEGRRTLGARSSCAEHGL